MDETWPITYTSKAGDTLCVICLGLTFHEDDIHLCVCDFLVSSIPVADLLTTARGH